MQRTTVQVSPPVSTWHTNIHLHILTKLPAHCRALVNRSWSSCFILHWLSIHWKLASYVLGKYLLFWCSLWFWEMPTSDKKFIVKSKTFLWDEERFSIVLQRNVAVSWAPNSQGRRKKENVNAGNCFPTSSPEPKNPNSGILVPYMQFPQISKGFVQNQSLDNTLILCWCPLLLQHWLQKSFAPRSASRSVFSIQLKTTKKQFSVQITCYGMNSSIFYLSLTN